MSIYASTHEIPAKTFQGSHLYPTPDTPPALIALAVIPPYCVPGRQDTELDDSDATGEWLRIYLATVGPHGGEWANQPMIPPGGEVVIDRKAARGLALLLLAWSESKEVKPTRKALAEYREQQSAVSR